jgi:proline dehydrogenase
VSLVEASDLLRGALLGLSKSDLVRTTIEKAPVSRDVVARYVPGTTVADAVQATAELRATNRLATLDYLGEDTTERAQAEHTRDTYVALLDAARTRRPEPVRRGRGQSQAQQPSGSTCRRTATPSPSTWRGRSATAAERAGTTVTLDMEDHTTTDRRSHAP